MDPEGEVVCSAGATGAFYCACMALLNQGDEVIVLEPYYGYHVNTLLAMGAVPRFVSMHPPEWELDLEKVKETIGPRTKAIVVNTPSNPSGKVFSRAELKGLADLAVDHDLFIFSDEIYEYFVYDDRQHVSPLSFSEARDRVVVISGYSKTFSITGWRIGYAVCDKKWARMIGYMNDLVYVCAPAPAAGGRGQRHRGATGRVLSTTMPAVPGKEGDDGPRASGRWTLSARPAGIVLHFGGRQLRPRKGLQGEGPAHPEGVRSGQRSGLGLLSRWR